VLEVQREPTRLAREFVEFIFLLRRGQAGQVVFARLGRGRLGDDLNGDGEAVQATEVGAQDFVPLERGPERGDERVAPDFTCDA
jgi:hypothetical protein